MNENSRLNAISSELYKMLNNKLSRISPIFHYEPGVGISDGHYGIHFPEFLDDPPFEVKPEYSQPQLIWFIFEGLILCRQMPKDLDGPEDVGLILRKDCPIYIDCIIEAVRKHSRKNFIVIDDALPEALIIDIDTSFRAENERELLLRGLANDFLREGGSFKLKKGIQKILNNKKLSMRDSVQRLLTLSGLGVQGDFSYCLRCGEAINKSNTRNEPNLFCINRTYSNPNECRNIFRHWLKSRLGLSSPEERKKHASKLYKDLQRIIRLRALVAFEELQAKHPKLYGDGRSSRSTRRPNQ